MTKKISRRSFIRTSAGVVVGASLATGCGKTTPSDKEDHELAVVTGKDRFEITKKAVNLVGGMEKYVPKNSKVCILPNSQKNNPGVYTHPEVVRAVVRMCHEAGAKEVNCLSWLKKKSWESTGLAQALEEEKARLVLVDMKDKSQYKKVEVKRGVKLKEAHIMKAFYENDVFITLPICKDHAGNRFTGTLKNMMGLNMQEAA